MFTCEVKGTSIGAYMAIVFLVLVEILGSPIAGVWWSAALIPWAVAWFVYSKISKTNKLKSYIDKLPNAIGIV